MADRSHYSISTNEIREILRKTGTLVFDGDDEDDNVPNSYRYYPRLDVAAALEELARRIGSQPQSESPNERDETSSNDNASGQSGSETSNDNSENSGPVEASVFAAGAAALGSALATGSRRAM